MSPLWRTFISPGVQLMQRLRLPFKVGLIGLMLFVPMVALLVLATPPPPRPAMRRANACASG